MKIRDILVVDNDEAITAFLKMYLEERGYSVSTARDGLEALKILKDAKPDVIFIDLIMPNIDGRKLAELIRKDEKSNETHLVVLSAISPEEDFDFSELGFDACIAKGPLKTVGENVLTILEGLESVKTEALHYKVLGVENLYKREITKELLSIKKHFELILANMAESIIELSEDGTIIYANPSALDLLDIPEEKLLASHLTSVLSDGEKEKINSLLARIDQGETVVHETEPFSLNEKKVAVELYTLFDDGQKSVIVMLNDITEQIEAENATKRLNEELERRVAKRTKELKAEVEEKEIILKEVHHRVKNNLAIISSLLTMRKRRSENEQVSTVLQEVQDRIKAISLIHEKLYQSKSFTKVKFKDYIIEIAGYLRSSMGTLAEKIDIEINASDIYLGIDKAIPGAMIINELISNAFKHAFPESHEGTIGVNFLREENARYIVEVTDNGTEFPPNFNFKDADTTGFRIIQTLVRQLGGTIKLEKSPKKKFTITFPI